MQLPWLEDRGIALVRGRGRLMGDKRVTVALKAAEEELEARKAVFLAGGTLPAMPPIEGLDEIDDAWTNRDATTAKVVPDSIVVLGGGVVGVEVDVLKEVSRIFEAGRLLRRLDFSPGAYSTPTACGTTPRMASAS